MSLLRLALLQKVMTSSITGLFPIPVVVAVLLWQPFLFGKNRRKRLTSVQTAALQGDWFPQQKILSLFIYALDK